MGKKGRRPVPFSESLKPGQPLARLKAVILDHAREIEAIGARGEIAVVVCEPSETWSGGLRQHGWTGEAVFPMGQWMRLAVSTSDRVTERWVASPRPATTRIFAVVHEDSLLLNHTATDGYTVEPGSTDAEGEN